MKSHDELADIFKTNKMAGTRFVAKIRVFWLDNGESIFKEFQSYLAANGI